MKHVFRLTALRGLVVLALLLSASAAMAQITAELRQSFGGTFIQVAVVLKNPSPAPVAIGDCDFGFSINNTAINGPSISFVRRGRFDVSTAPSEYRAMDAVWQTTTNTAVVGIKVQDTIRTGISILPNGVDTVAVVRFNINANGCSQSNTISWFQAGTVLNDIRFNNILANPFADLTVLAPATIRLAPPLPAFTVQGSAGTPARPAAPNGQLVFCANENITLSVAPIPGVTLYQFFNGNTPLAPASATPSITRAGNATPAIQNGDNLYCVVTNPNCTYRSANAITAILQNRLASPSLLGQTEAALDTGINGCATGFAGSQTQLQVGAIAGILGYSWELLPAAIGTISPTTTGTSNSITWTGAGGLCTLRVWARNFCGNGDTLVKTFRVYTGVPTIAQPLRRAFRLDSTARDPRYYVNNPNNYYFEIPVTDVNHREIQWAVGPQPRVFVPPAPDEPRQHTLIDPQVTPFTAEDRAYILPSEFKDKWRVKVQWSRFADDTVGWVKYRAVNACGKSAWDSLRVEWYKLVPKPDSVRLIQHGGTVALSGDSFCQGTDSSFFRAYFRQAFAGTKYADTLKYRYFVVRDDVESAIRLARLTGNAVNTTAPGNFGPIANYLVNYNRYFRSDSTGFWVRWNPLYYGSVRVIAAGMTDTAAAYGGTPPSRLGNSGVFAPAIDTSSMGDTAHVKVFIMPKPLRPTVTPRTFPDANARAIHRGVDTFVDIALYDTVTSAFVAPEYATSGVWKLRPVTPIAGFTESEVGTFVPTTIGSVNTTASVIRLNLASNARPGYYWVNMRGVNSCGIGLDSSASLLIHITDTIARKPGPIEKITATTLTGFDFCQGTATVDYRVPLNTTRDYTFYRWRLVPASAGTITFQGTGADANRTDQGAIRVVWSPTFNDYRTGARLYVYGVNGTNRNNYLTSTAVDSVTIRVFPQPTANSGMAVNCNITMPNYSSAWLGAGLPLQNRYAAPAGPFAPTFAGNISPEFKLRWSSGASNPAGSLVMLSNGRLTQSTTATSVTLDPDSAHYFNPVFTPTREGGYAFSLVIIDSSGCESVPSTSSFTVEPSLNVKLNGFLAGALVQPVTPNQPRMRTDYYNTPSAQYPRPGSFLSRYERNTGQCGTEYMMPGFPLKKIVSTFAGTDSMPPVDVVTIGLLSDWACPPTGGPALQVVAEGKAWLYPDGQIRDFETGESDFARLVSAGPFGIPDPLPTNMIAYIKHGNHLSLFSNLSQSFVPTTGATAPGLTPAAGGANLRILSNVARQAVYTSGIGSETVINYTPATPITQQRVAAIAGKVTQTTPVTTSINAFDLQKIVNYLGQTGTARTDVYQGLDVNLDTRVDQADLNIIRNNAALLKHSIINR